MSAASVGYQCPDCTKGGSQQVYTARDIPQFQPTVTIAIMAACVAVFVGQLVTQDVIADRGLLWGPSVADGELWRIVTSAFLHGSPMHLGFNLWALWVFGKPLEEAVGRLKFVLIYLAGLFGGSLAVLAFNFSTPTLGASGAVLGCAGALAALLWARGIKIWQTSLGFIFLLNLGLPLLPGTNISFWGHFGGMVAGAIAGWLLYMVPSQRRDLSPGLLIGAGVALCAVLGVATVIVGNSGGLIG